MKGKRMEAGAGITGHDHGQTSEPPTIAVVIAAYTLERWDFIKKAVASARNQTLPAVEVVLCIDNNQELFERAHAELTSTTDTPVRVLANRYDDHLAGRDRHEKAHGTLRRFGAGSVRNTAVEAISAEIIAFLDDDAWADPDWLEELSKVHRERPVVAVGGGPLPDYETTRPAWFPRNFDWVFGCAYEGLPTTVAPARRLFGGNMAVRRTAFEEIGGFHDVDFDDLDLCSRLVDRFGPERVCYTPSAVIHHWVPAERVTWEYFCKRCFAVNREKVGVFQAMGEAASMSAERDFVRRALLGGGMAEVRRGLSGEPAAFLAAGVMLVGIALAGLGHLVGRFDAVIASRRAQPAPDPHSGT